MSEPPLGQWNRPDRHAADRAKSPVFTFAELRDRQYGVQRVRLLGGARRALYEFLHDRSDQPVEERVERAAGALFRSDLVGHWGLRMGKRKRPAQPLCGAPGH